MRSVWIILGGLLIVAIILVGNEIDQSQNRPASTTASTGEQESPAAQPTPEPQLGTERVGALALVHAGAHVCTVDCSSRSGGYEWAEKHEVNNHFGCSPSSESLVEGCEVYVDEWRTVGSHDDEDDEPED